MKHIYCIIFTLFILTAAKAQDTIIPNEGQSIDNESAIKVKPSFLGGIEKFFEYIKDGLKGYKLNKGDKGAYVFFIIEKDGSLSTPTIKNSSNEKLNERIKELIIKSPKWNPGTVNGEPVRASRLLPLE